MAFVRSSKFRHVFGKPLRKDQSYDGLRITKISWESSYCAVNKKFVAVLTDSMQNMAFIVIPLAKTGRQVMGDLPLVAGHRGAVLDLEWNPFDDNVIASSSEDFTIKIWTIPENFHDPVVKKKDGEEGLVKHLEEPTMTLEAHDKRVGIIKWHPTAKNVLLSAGHDLQIFIWDAGTGEALVQMDCHPDLIHSVSWNWLGNKICTTCKDKKIRVMNARTGDIEVEGPGHAGSKMSRAVFTKEGDIFTTGFSRMSTRQYALWDGATMKQKMIEDIDQSNGVMFPIYDPDVNMIYLIGKGDSLIRYYEVTAEEPFVHYLALYQSGTPQRGFGIMPKRGCDPNINEIMRVYKVQGNGYIEVIPFTVPRKSTQYSSDIYPETRAETPAITADEWIDQQVDKEPIMTSMADLYEGEVRQSKVRVRPKSTLDGGSTPSSVTAAAKTRPVTTIQEEKKPEPKPEPKREPVRPEPVRAEPPKPVVKETAPPPAEPAPAAARDIPDDFDFKAVVDDIRKLKLIVKAHERRIKTLEERLAEKENEEDGEVAEN